MASPNLTELVTTTLRDRQGELADNVSKSNALLSTLNARGNIDLVDGGRTIVRELEYAENSTFQYYSGLVSRPVRFRFLILTIIG